jgi:glycosyltransferase involved in cell wall biosynthesis
MQEPAMLGVSNEANEARTARCTDLNTRLVASCSVVVPVFNGAATLDKLVSELAGVLPGLANAYEAILVNDGSSDSSWDAITRLCTQFAWLRGIDLARNFGQHNALLCGIRAARSEVVVTMDDDLQHPPAEIYRLLCQLAAGYDVVYGTPAREQHGLMRDVASRVTKLALQSAMGAETARNVSAFRAFRTRLRDAFGTYQNPTVSIDVLLTWGTRRFSAVSVRQDPRRAGVSNYTFRRLVIHALDMMTGFSRLPLQLASIVGFAFTMFGFAVLLYVLGRYLIEGDVVQGFPFLASTIAIFSGAQLFALGIMGEYLSRMHFRMMDKPSYVIRDETSLTNGN